MLALTAVGLGLAAVIVTGARGPGTGGSASGDSGCIESEVALIRAAHIGDHTSVREALAEGVGADARDRAGNSALACAGPRGHVDVVRALITAGATTAATARDGDSLVGDAVLFCQPDVLDLLLAAGAPITSTDRDGRDLLSIAVKVADRRTISVLLDHGADVEGWELSPPGLFGPTESTSPCPEPTPAGTSEVLTVLLDHGAPPDQVLEAAVLFDAPEAAGSAVEAGADPGGDAPTSVSFLLRLIQTGQDQPIIDEAGGRRTSTGGLGSDPVLVVAAAEGHVEVVSILLAAGADVDASAEGGWTALHAGAAGGHRDVVEALVAAGASAVDGAAPVPPSALVPNEDDPVPSLSAHDRSAILALLAVVEGPG